MAVCELLHYCPFFNNQMDDMPSKSETYKILYCKGDSSNCARHIVFTALGREDIPADLYPNQADPSDDLLT